MHHKTRKTLAGCFAALALLGITACGGTADATTPLVPPAAQVQPAQAEYLDPTTLRSTRGSGKGRVLFDCTWATSPRSPYVRCY